jgi:outer membrane protein assembly factor BamB
MESQTLNRGQRRKFKNHRIIMNCRKILIPLLVALGLSMQSSVTAENWPQWRGPNFDGSTSAQGLPTEFSKTKNVKWMAELPGASAATPIIWEDKVFISSTDEDRQTLQAMCLDRKTGKVLWNQDVGVGLQRQPARANYASPSPLTDGNLVYFFYGNGSLIAFDLDGKKVWTKNIESEHGQFAFQWDFSSSPMLYDGILYLQVLQRNVPVHGRGRQNGPSYLLAMDPKTGEELWKHIRPSEARAESLEAFSTPIPFTHEGRAEILIVGGDAISGHDPKTGQEFWRWGSWNPSHRIGHWRLVPSPVAGGGVILACAPKGEPVFAVKAGLNGPQDDSALAWSTADKKDITSDVPTPLFYDGHFYILNRERPFNIACMDPSGKVIWSERLESRSFFETSPTGADGKIYFMNEKGEAWVIAAGNEFKILHRASMGEPNDSLLRSSISVAHGNLFIRTGNKLYCIEERN